MATDPCDTTVGYLKTPHKVYKADSGAMKFRVTLSRSRRSPLIYLLNKECPHKPLYKIKLSESGKLYNLEGKENINFILPDFNQPEYHDLWLTWYNDVICMGFLNQPPFLKYKEDKNSTNKQIIGFIKFIKNYDYREFVEWDILSSSDMTIHRPMQPLKEIEDGKLKWVVLNKGGPLPKDALIGGFEEEPLYIVRPKGACPTPGKYIKSNKCAYIPVEDEEFHESQKFEILCGYDVMWQKCVLDQIPDNAFIAGKTGYNHEPLYIGRAQVQNFLEPGKVQASDKKCSVLFQGKVLSTPVYEILVIPYKPILGESSDFLCYTKMNMKLCL